VAEAQLLARDFGGIEEPAAVEVVVRHEHRIELPLADLIAGLTFPPEGACCVPAADSA